MLSHTTLRMSLPIVIFCLLAMTAQPADAYFQGDIVPIFKRMQYKQSRGMWSEVMIGQTPTFGVNKMVQLHGLAVDQGADDEAVKLQLSVDHDKFMSPWITLIDGQHKIKGLKVVFEYRGAEIISMHCTPTYEQSSLTSSSLYVKFVWFKQETHDTRLGLNTMFVVGCLASLASILAVAFDPKGVLSSRPILASLTSADGRRVEKLMLVQDDNAAPGLAPLNMEMPGTGAGSMTPNSSMSATASPGSAMQQQQQQLYAGQSPSYGYPSSASQPMYAPASKDE